MLFTPLRKVMYKSGYIFMRYKNVVAKCASLNQPLFVHSFTALLLEPVWYVSGSIINKMKKSVLMNCPKYYAHILQNL